MAQMESLSLLGRDQNGNTFLNNNYASGPSTCSSGYNEMLVDDIDEDMDEEELKPKLSKEEYMQKLMMEYYKRTILKSNDLNISYINNFL